MLNPQADRVDGGERERNQVVVRDRADAESAIGDVDRKTGGGSFVPSVADQNTNRLHPTRAVPGLTGGLPTVPVSGISSVTPTFVSVNAVSVES